MPVTLGGTVIKSVQRGGASVTQAGTTNVTITSVDVDKSFVTCAVTTGYGHTGSSFGSSTAGRSGGGTGGSARLVNATTVTLAAGSQYGSYYKANPAIYWEVIEYE